MRSTIADIAAKAGVSTATVDRVLNGRAGVSARTKQTVLGAARSVGYLSETDGVAMPSKPVFLEFIIPVGTNTFLVDLADSIEEFAGRLPLVEACKIHRLDTFDPVEFENAIDEVGLETSGIGVIALDHPTCREPLRRLTDAGVRVVTIASDIPSVPRQDYVGIDNRVAGRTAGLLMGRMIGAERRSVAVFLGSASYRGHEERESGFRSILASDFPDLTLLPPVEIADASQAGYIRAGALLERHLDIGGIYCIGGGRNGVVRATNEAKGPRPMVICHDLTEDTRRFLLRGQVDVVIDQNAHLIAEQSVIKLLGTIATSTSYLTPKLVEPRIILRENLPFR